MANLIITEFCLYSGIREKELNKIIKPGVIKPYNGDGTPRLFNDYALDMVQRALHLRRDLVPNGQAASANN